MAWLPGTQIGSYEIVGTLGEGGMGEVFRVRHLISDRIEAMKVLLSASSSSQDMLDRFTREIRVLAGLNHPNIAALHTAFRHENQLVMIMEYVDGHDLRRCLQTGITLGEAVAFTQQVLAALDYAHSQNVIHRDIKPSNIMLTTDGRVKLLDFGIALATPDARLTMTGSVVGSMHYIPPEQIYGEAPDARSDLYGMGVTLYEMVTGRLPIEGTNYAQVIAAHLQKRPVPPHLIDARIPEALSVVVMKALDKEKGSRWQTAREFSNALCQAYPSSSAQYTAPVNVTVNVPGNVPVNLPIRAPSNIPLNTPVGGRVNTPSMPVSAPAAYAPAQASAVVSGSKYQPEQLSEISQKLAAYVGPIASVLVKRASSSSNNLRELCDQVAAEIESAEARQKFLTSVRGQLRNSGLL
jgi:eukaryotic-like serine/threonine-protein kinase